MAHASRTGGIVAVLPSPAGYPARPSSGAPSRHGADGRGMPRAAASADALTTTLTTTTTAKTGPGGGRKTR